MFERFTPAAKELVIEAQAQRSALDHKNVRTEHLLLALLASDGPCGDVLRRQGLDVDRIVTRLKQTNVPADPSTSKADDQLLKGLGIDVDAIRHSLDQTFGPGALDRARDQGKPDRADLDGSGGGARNGRFDSRSKRVLELSLRETLRLKTKHIGPEHIGLGILREGQGVACRLLADEGLKLADLRSSWEAIALGATAR